MITNLKQINEKEMLRNWALAEVSSERRIPYLQKYFSDEILQKISNNKISEFSDTDWGTLEKMIRSERSKLLDGLLILNIDWYKGNFFTEELNILSIMNWPPFVNLAGSRKFVDLVKKFQEGMMPPNHYEFEANIKKIKDDFDFAKIVGMPILVSKNIDPPYFLIEGFTRLSAMLLNIWEGRQYTKKLSVILGVSKQINKWEYS